MLTTAVNIATLLMLTASLVTQIYVLLRMIQITREARIAREAALEATVRAQEVAAVAAAHAETAAVVISAVAEKVEVLIENTNGVSQRLEKLAGEAGEQRGIAIGVAQAEAKKE